MEQDRLYEIAYRYMHWKLRRPDFKWPSDEKRTFSQIATDIGSTLYKVKTAAEHFRDMSKPNPSLDEIRQFGPFAYDYMRDRFSRTGRINAELSRNIGNACGAIGIETIEGYNFVRHIIRELMVLHL